MSFMMLARIAECSTKLVHQFSDSPVEAMDKKFNNSSFDSPSFVWLSDVIVRSHKRTTESCDKVAMTGIPTGVPTGDVTRAAQPRAHTQRARHDIAERCSTISASTL